MSSVKYKLNQIPIKAVQVAEILIALHTALSAALAWKFLGTQTAFYSSCAAES